MHIRDAILPAEEYCQPPAHPSPHDRFRATGNEVRSCLVTYDDQLWRRGRAILAGEDGGVVVTMARPFIYAEASYLHRSRCSAALSKGRKDVVNIIQ